MAGMSSTLVTREREQQEAPEPRFLKINPGGRLNFMRQWSFDTHRSGWPAVLDRLTRLHNPKATLFDGFVEQNFGWHRVRSAQHGEIPYATPWIGMMHNPPGMPAFFDHMASPQVILESHYMKESLPYCRGLYVFSNYHRQWLQERVDCPVESLVHPTESTDIIFDWDEFENNPVKHIVQIGFWLRKIHSIRHLAADGFRKIWVVPHDYARRKREDEANAIDVFDGNGLDTVGDYEEWPRLIDVEYDEMLSRNIVFVNLYDASANNAVLECMVRNTPILINRLPAVEEYLGVDYPLYFDDLDEASRKLADNTLLKAAHQYLAELDKHRLDPDYFVESIENSAIYRNAPVLDNRQLARDRGPKVDQLADLNIVHGQPLKNDFVFVVSFRNQARKIKRCLKTIVRQCANGHDAGIVLIDDESEDGGFEIAMDHVRQSGVQFVAIRNEERKLYTRNLYNAVNLLVERDRTVIIEVDGDDYLEDTDVLGVVRQEYKLGARKTFGSFRMSPGSKQIPGFDLVEAELVTNLANPWDLDFCFPWMHLKTYRRELFCEVPLVYFWERDRRDWLKTAEDLSSHPMMTSMAGPDVHYIKDVLYVYDFSGMHHELNQIDRPRYVVEKLYRVPAGRFIGEYWDQVRREKSGELQQERIGPRLMSLDHYGETRWSKGA